MAFLKESFNSW